MSGRPPDQPAEAPLPAYAAAGDLDLTRNRILASAARLFSRDGFRSTTIRDISEIVGILSGSLFHYFKSKEQMLFEVMYESALAICLRAEALEKATPEPGERLRALVRLQLECMLSERTRDFYAVLISEWRELNERYKGELAVLQRRHYRTWDRVLGECARAGLLRGEPRTTRLALLGSVHWANTWFRQNGRLSVDEYADFLERVYLQSGPSRPQETAG